MNKLILLFLSSFLFACSDSGSNEPAKNDHVWKEQVETIDKAKEVEGLLLDSAEQTRKSIEYSE